MYVPCVDFDTFKLNWADYKLFPTQEDDILAQDKNVANSNTAEPVIKVGSQPVMSVCYEGRAVRCLPKTGSGLTGEWTDRDSVNAWTLNCVLEAGDAADKDTFKPNAKVESGGTTPLTTPAWEIVPGAIGEKVKTFTEMFPHCLPASPMPDATTINGFDSTKK